jgi:hypothetical protein
MSWRSHLRVALLAPALAACAGSEDEVRTVAAEAYPSRPCWFEPGGEFSAFLVLASKDGRAIPYPISGKCIVEPGQRSLGLATLRQIGIVALIDRHGALQRAFPAVSISTSVNTDQEMPSPDTKLYFFRARVTNVRLPSGTAYAPTQILQLVEVNMPFERFLELTAIERANLWRARNP